MAEPKGRDIPRQKGPASFKSVKVGKIKVRLSGHPGPQVDPWLNRACVETRVQTRVDSVVAASPLFAGLGCLRRGPPL